MLALIGGTSLMFADLPPLERERIPTPFGPADVLCGDFLMLLRHQWGLPPHRINFRAQMAALAIRGADRVVAVGSSGSLKKEITPGSVVIPHDYLSWGDVPSIHDHAIAHVRPELDPLLHQELCDLLPGSIPRGVYVQTRGPRIETVAEVQALARIADVVGMTIASEATLARELDLRFAAVCTVDNYAHGLGKKPLTFDQLLDEAWKHRGERGEMIRRIIEVMA
ncbi:MAG: MTAP family purine nucleoside phosphorylase [Methanomicrobiales archaeon]|nr:MTAP family purine nucleoside phosphorylase [Methanomicrobiales archaeon]MDD1655628.1 MTAP family purine nucleoside phosphorylase [Methanomicrobiales archaeon]